MVFNGCKAELEDCWLIPCLFLFNPKKSFIVDAADKEKFEPARKELHDLLSKPPLAGIPVLVLGNKNDIPEAVGVDELIEKL